MDSQSRARRWIRVLVALFIGVYAIGFLPGPPNLFLVALVPLGVIAVGLLVRLPDMEDSATTPVRVTAVSTLVFVTGVLYGTAGMWGFYDLVDWLYISWVLLGLVGFSIAAVRSLRALRTAR